MALWVFYILLVAPFLYSMHEPIAVTINNVTAIPFFFLILTNRRTPPGNRWLVWLVRLGLVLLALMGLSSLKSVDPTVSVPFFVKFVGLVGVAGIGFFCGREDRTWGTLAWGAVFAGLIHGSLALAEFIEAPPVPATWMDPALKSIMRTRCGGIFGEPNVLGAFLAALIPLVIGSLFLPRGRGPDWVLSACSLFFAGFGLFVTFSRGAFVAAVVGVAVLFLLKRPYPEEKLQRRILGAFFLFALLLAIIGPFRARIASIFQPSDMTFSQRTLINQSVLANLSLIPILGFGPHTFSQVYPRFRLVGGDYPLYAHNEFLQTLVEGGPLSMVILVFITCMFLAWLHRLWKVQEPGLTWHQAAGIAVWTSLFVANLSGFSDRIFPTALLFFLGGGFVLSTMVEPSQGTVILNPPGAARVLGGFVLVVILLMSLKFLHLNLLLEGVEKALSSGRTQEARSSLTELMASGEESPIVLDRLAGIFQEERKYAIAAKIWGEALQKYPGEAMFWYKLSRLSSMSGIGDPYQPIIKAIELDPASEHFRLVYAGLLAKAGRKEEAIEQLDAALARSPGHHEVYRTYLAVEELKRGLLSSATEYLPEDPKGGQNGN